jgi:hypothetical protein
VYKLRPASCALTHARGISHEHAVEDVPAHLYDLRRGRTTGVFEQVEGDRDGRWIALSTRNRTVHVFAVNPYGGRPDDRSHLEGRVRNPTELQPSSADVQPIARLRGRRSVGTELRSSAPLAFTFVNPDIRLPMALLPPPASYTTPTSPPRSLPPSPAQVPLSSPSSAAAVKRSRNHQDVLLFDPTTGSLLLHRVTLERRTSRDTSSLPLPIATSMSLPSAATLTRMGSSPPARTPSGLTQMLERPADLISREAVIASWYLKRARGWKEIKHIVVFNSTVPGQPSKYSRSE